MDGACSTLERCDYNIQRFWPENLKVRDTQEDLGVDGKIPLE
jgi:hypothetical protein